MEPEAVPDGSEVTFKKYRCPSCGFVNRFATFPWHPLVCTHYCAHCERPHSIQVRESSIGKLEELVDENKEVAFYRKRGRSYSLPSFSKEQLRREVDMVRARMNRDDSRRVATTLGPAILIDP